jgi:hypothetical protein
MYRSDIKDVWRFAIAGSHYREFMELNLPKVMRAEYIYFNMISFLKFTILK